MEPTTGLILRRITETDLSVSAHKLATVILDGIAWKDDYNGLPRGSAAFTLSALAEKQGIALTYIQPGKPQQNAYVERYNRTVRHEWLDLYIFETIEEVQQIATEWLWIYKNERPNMGIGGVTPSMKLKMAA